MKAPKNSSIYVAAAYFAERISIAGNVAFWMRERNADCEDHHRLQMINQFKCLADTLGYDVTERE